MEKITVYEKPTCTTCRTVSKILSDKGVEYDKIDYYIYPFGKNKLKELLRLLKIPASELLRKNETIYKELDLKNKRYSEDQLIDLMVLKPDLVQRPIVVMGNKAVVARPPEKVLELFK